MVWDARQSNTHSSRSQVMQYEADDYSFKTTELGKVMARYNLTFKTIQIMATIPPDAEIETLLDLFSHCGEFSAMRPRMGEKKVLKELNKGRKRSNPDAKDNPSAPKKKQQISEGRKGIRYPIKEGVKETADKISVLLQGTIAVACFDRSCIHVL